jgi:hypothetical protein
MALMMFVAASPVFAAHDHGSHDSMDHGASQGSKDDQSAKEDKMLINSCAQQIARLQERIYKLQAEMAGKNAGTAVRDELKKLEQKLKEANDIARPLQIF